MRFVSDLIPVGQKTEKFIFYGGLGKFRTKLQATSTNASKVIPLQMGALTDTLGAVAVAVAVAVGRQHEME
jgi:hypothetical protein